MKFAHAVGRLIVGTLERATRQLKDCDLFVAYVHFIGLDALPCSVCTARATISDMYYVIDFGFSFASTTSFESYAMTDFLNACGLLEKSGGVSRVINVIV